MKLAAFVVFVAFAVANLYFLVVLVRSARAAKVQERALDERVARAEDAAERASGYRRTRKGLR